MCIRDRCKWKNNLNDVAAIQDLMKKHNLLAEYTDRWYYIFSKVPFSDQAEKLATDHIRLITADMLYILPDQDDGPFHS